MIITWHGFNYFKLKTPQHSIAFNPYSLDKNIKFSKSNADLVLVTDSSKFDGDKKAGKGAFVVESAGEYEVDDIFVYGRQTDSGHLIYLLNFEDIKIAFLGEYGHDDLANGDLELVEGSDILILPVAGGDLTTAKEANRLISQIEPRIVVPSCYKEGGGKSNSDSVDIFIKELGLKPEKADKFKIKKSDLPQDELKLVILDKQ